MLALADSLNRCCPCGLQRVTHTLHTLWEFLFAVGRAAEFTAPPHSSLSLPPTRLSSHPHIVLLACLIFLRLLSCSLHLFGQQFIPASCFKFFFVSVPFHVSILRLGQHCSMVFLFQGLDITKQNQKKAQKKERNKRLFFKRLETRK